MNVTSPNSLIKPGFFEKFGWKPFNIVSEWVESGKAVDVT